MRAMFWVGCGVVVLAAVFGAGRLGAEGKNEKPAKAAPRLRVGMFNLTEVIKSYSKYKDFQEEIKKTVLSFQHKDQELRDQGAKLDKKRQRPGLSEGEKEEIAAVLTAISQQIEDNNAEAKKVLGKKSEEQMDILYRDVREAANDYATTHGLDLVLHYNDATTEKDLNSPPNITRKVQTGALMPIYCAPGIDITKNISEMLNRRRGAAK